MEKIKIKTIEIIIRIGVFGTFLGHGINAISVKPQWILFITFFEFTEKQAIPIMQTIGMVDIVVACLILFYPIRIIVFWAIFWAFSAALMRPFTGFGILEFIERSSNFCLPLALLISQGFPKNFKGLFTIRNKK